MSPHIVGPQFGGGAVSGQYYPTTQAIQHHGPQQTQHIVPNQVDSQMGGGLSDGQDYQLPLRAIQQHAAPLQGFPAIENTVVGSHNPPSDPPIHQSSVPFAAHTHNGGYPVQQPLPPAPQVVVPNTQPVVPTFNTVVPVMNRPVAAPPGGNSGDSSGQNTLRPFGFAACTPGASSNPNLHTCGWLVERDDIAKECGASIANDEASIDNHIALWHDVNTRSDGGKLSGWAMDPSLGTSRRCSHDPAGKNTAKKIRKMHLGPNADNRVCDYLDCMVSTGRARGCAAHLNASW